MRGVVFPGFSAARALARPLVVWAAHIRYSITREMMFQSSFLLWIGVEVVWFAAQMVFVEVVYGHVDTVAGWGKYEVVLLVGTSFFIQQLFQAFLMVNCMNLPDLIRTGKLDFFIAQPAPTQFLASTRMFDPGGLVNAAIGLGVCAYAVARLGIGVSLGGCATFAAWSLLGVVIHYSIMMMLVTLSFWIVKSQGMTYGYYNIFQLARVPREAFRGPARVVFTFVIPVLLVAGVPCNALLGREASWALAWVAVSAAVLLSASVGFFQLGLRRYSSASS